MAPLSILPGRIRFEAPLLSGRRDGCRRFEERMTELPGVAKVSANHRTGRILVRFDEEIVNRDELTERIEKALATVEEESTVNTMQSASPEARGARKGGISSHVARHFVLDMVTHAILPAPLDLLLPTAVAALRR